jgi:hypothetical protein
VSSSQLNAVRVHRRPQRTAGGVFRLKEAMSEMGGEFNGSTQHLLILSDREVCDGGACADMVHTEAEGRALGALEGRPVCGGYRPRA